MRIVCIGGGPAGLYFSLLMKRLDPRHDVTVFERNRAGETFGWGVVFSDETLSHFAEADPESHHAITRRFAYWSDIELRVGGERLRSSGHGFCGIARPVFLDLLEARCRTLGVRIVHETEVDDPAAFADADLVLASDGANSKTRERLAAAFQPQIEWGRCRFAWLGTDLRLPAFTFVFKDSPHGLFQAHAYPFDAERSTFIVECHEGVWRRAGLDRADEARTLAYLEALFREDLDGHRLLANRSIWRAFPTIRNARWHEGNVVLIGDAAHTAHFSIGSGTKLAMEDAIALAGAFRAHADRASALPAYQAAREPQVARLQAAAAVSRDWFENTERHARLAPPPFAFGLMTRSGRISYEGLRRRDPELVRRVAAYWSEAAGTPHEPGATGEPPDPALTRFRLGSLELANRLVAFGGNPERNGASAGLVLMEDEASPDPPPAQARLGVWVRCEAPAAQTAAGRERAARAARLADQAGCGLFLLELGEGSLDPDAWDAARAAWPRHKPLGVRIAVGQTAEREPLVALARAIEPAGAALVSVRGSARVTAGEILRLECGLATLVEDAAGDLDQAHTLVAAGRADLVGLAT